MATRAPRQVSATTVHRLARGWLALAALATLALATIAATRTWRAIAAHGTAAPSLHLQEVPATTPAPAPLAAPAKGVTGTIPLPPLPLDAMPTSPAPTAVAARAFSLAGIAAIDRGRALQCLAEAIYYEAATEPDAGQAAVAQVVLNRVRHPAFPATVCGVVYQGSERTVCQFSFACDGAMARPPSRAGWARATRAAAAALSGHVQPGVGLATHYHTYAVTPAWNRSLVMTDVVGAHFFHRWKGWWGTAPAFRQRYAGGEPMPGPHGRARLLADTTPPPRPVTEAAVVTPAFADSGRPLMAAAPAEDPLPQSGEVLDRWKDSGQPLPSLKDQRR